MDPPQHRTNDPLQNDLPEHPASDQDAINQDTTYQDKEQEDTGQRDTEQSAVTPSQLLPAADVISRLDRLWSRSPPQSLGTNEPPGRRIAHFDLQRVLGSGAFGVVYLALDTQLNREVALKLPRPEVLVDDEKRERFSKEAELAARLDHPGIVPIYGANLDGPTPYISSAYCPGPNLAEWLSQRSERTPWRECVELIAAVADAVHYAHESGVLHRDLKPANILLLPQDGLAFENNSLEQFRALLSDFGLAKLSDPTLTDTRSSLLVGTPMYMAPEQLENDSHGKDLAATDVYSLGVILFELLTSQLPIAGESYIEMLDSIRNTRAKRLREIRQDLPRNLERICAKCLEKNPAARYSTAADLATDLRHCAEGESIEGQSLGVLRKAAYWCTRPQRIRDAGRFALSVELIMAFWTAFMAAFMGKYILQYDLVTKSELTTLQLQAAFVVIFLHLPMAWAGWQTIQGKRWGCWLGIALTLLNLPGILIAIFGEPVLFASLYSGDRSYFGFNVYIMLLICFAIQLFLFCCAAAAMYRLDSKTG